MAKKSQRRSLRYEREQLGCMWSFMSMFNFRTGRSAQKLLTERRHGSKRSTSAAARNLRKMPDELKDFNQTCLHQEIDGEERTVAKDAGKPSVKKLIEKELFSEKKTKKEIMDGESGQLSDSELEDRRKKNQRRKNRIRKNSCDNFSHINDHPEFEVSLDSKHQSLRSLDIDNMIEEFCCEIRRRNKSCKEHDQPNQKHEDYRKKLSELIKFLISQKLLHGNHPIENSEILTSKDLMEVFQILGSDEELFLKLLQDPDLLVSKDVQTLRNDLKEKEKEFSNPVEGEAVTPVETSNSSKQSDILANWKQLRFFRKKNKPLERKDCNQSQDSQRIVLLKPAPANLLSPKRETSRFPLSPKSHFTRNNEQSERISSHFFLAEIKRKLKNAIGKEQRGVPADSAIKEGFRKGIPTKDHFFIEKMARPSSGTTEDCEPGKELENSSRKQRLSNIYIEARRHLSEMLINGDIDPDISNKDLSKTLGRILSLPEYLSPLGSPGRKCPQSSASSAQKISASEEIQKIEEIKKEDPAIPLAQVNQEPVAQTCNSDARSDSLVELPHPISSKPKDENEDVGTETSMGDEITSEGKLEAVKDNEVLVELVHDETKTSDASSEECSSSTTINKQNDDASETHNNVNGESDILAQDPLHLSVNSKESQEGGTGFREWPSPVSVLEPLFPEEDITPLGPQSHSVARQIQPLCIQFEERDSSAENQASHAKGSTDDRESVFEYVKAVLDALNLTREELYIRSLSSDQLLEPALLSNIQFFPNQLCSDHELLFDCINDVLLELCGQQFGRSPWVSFIKPQIQSFLDMKDTIHEVQKGVYRNLVPFSPPRSLDQIIKMDLDVAGNWMDLRVDVDCIGIETVELLLDEILEEIIFECGSAITENKCSSVPVELQEDESIISL